MKIKITENQLSTLLLESKQDIGQSKFQKLFAFLFEKISKRFDYSPVDNKYTFFTQLQKYDQKYLNHEFFYHLYNDNVKMGINWFSDKLDYRYSISERSLIYLPTNLSISNYADLDNSHSFVRIPDNLRVSDTLWVQSIEHNLSMGNNIIVYDDLHLSYSNISELGDNLTVYGNLLINNTNISDIPKNLRIGGEFSVRNTPLSKKFNLDDILKMIKERGGTIAGKIIGMPKYSYEDPNITIWSPTNRASTYAFNRTRSNPQVAKLTNSFIEYVKTQNEKNQKATRKDFLEKNYPDKSTNTGYFSTFFASIKDAGIVSMNNKNEYVLGPNYQAYLEGKLRRQKWN